LSAWLIVNRIRWETTVETSSGDFKISNNFIAYYARLFMDEHPGVSRVLSDEAFEGWVVRCLNQQAC
jgi:hypothetical protein